MYNWVTYTWNPVRGRCPTDCVYCYVKSIPGRLDCEPYLVEKELSINLGKGNTIFVGSTIDLFASEIPSDWIRRVLDYCRKFQENTYIFQSKNPIRFLDFHFPKNTIIGTTLETNRNFKTFGITSKAPSPYNRACWIKKSKKSSMMRTFVSIEPIMDFDVNEFVNFIRYINPGFVSIGADSKGHNLPEPSMDKVEQLIAELQKFTEVKIKDNLKRLKK